MGLGAWWGGGRVVVPCNSLFYIAVFLVYLVCMCDFGYIFLKLFFCFCKGAAAVEEVEHSDFLRALPVESWGKKDLGVTRLVGVLCFFVKKVFFNQAAVVVRCSAFFFFFKIAFRLSFSWSLRLPPSLLPSRERTSRHASLAVEIVLIGLNGR